MVWQWSGVRLTFAGTQRTVVNLKCWLHSHLSKASCLSGPTALFCRSGKGDVNYLHALITFGQLIAGVVSSPPTYLERYFSDSQISLELHYERWHAGQEFTVSVQAMNYDFVLWLLTPVRPENKRECAWWFCFNYTFVILTISSRHFSAWSTWPRRNRLSVQRQFAGKHCSTGNLLKSSWN